MFKFNPAHISSTKNNFWFELIGSSSKFSLESRIFHSISIGIIILNGLYIPYNLFAGLYIGALSGFILGIFFFYQYYNSRFNGKKHSTVLFALFGILILGVNYFSNSGIHGSTDLIWPAYLLLVLGISPHKQHIIWLLVYLIGFFLLHCLEFYYPNLVQYPFLVGKGQFIDRITAFPLPVIATFLVIKFIKRSYDREKNLTDEKTIALEKSNEQILLQKNQLEESNSEKNKLMSIISHDLRSPLNNIQTYLVLLQQQEIDSTERPMIEEALLKSTNNAMEMLSNLLHWSRSQMEGTRVQLKAANLLTVLANTLEMENTSALKKGITLRYNIPPKLTVTADIDMLQLVVRNLTSNAIKFTSQGGNINVDAQILVNECKITISDNGQGIPDDRKEDIFTIKSKPSYGTANEKGVGLGLVLCKEFIDRQGGRLEFESTLGVGSSFFIFMPIKPTDNKTQED